MVTMNVSLPDQMKKWLIEQSETSRFGNTSDYGRSLICQDQERTRNIEAMQTLVSEGLGSELSQKSMDEIKAHAKATLVSR